MKLLSLKEHTELMAENSEEKMEKIVYYHGV